MSLQDDWLEYIESPESFTKYYFAPLITDTEEPINLELAFKSLPNGADFVERIKRVRAGTAFTGLYHIPASDGRISKADLKKLGERYADSISKRLRYIGDNKQADIVYYKPIEFIVESKFRDLWKSGNAGLLNASMDIEFDFVDFICEFPDYMDGLQEAVLHMTKSPPVTRYILSAIVDYPVDDEAYYELWAGGGDIEFCEDRTLIILPDDYEEPKVA